jgi:hypothetical protein
MLGIVAALNHTRPGSVFRAWLRSPHSMCGVASTSPFFLETPATCGISTNFKQIARSNDSCVSARAAAQPSDVFRFPSCRLQHSESSELLTRKFSAMHAAIIPEGGACYGLYV